MKWAFILGTRPEIIKLSPLIDQAIQEKINFIIIHTGQHYDAEMDDIFFKELKLPTPNYMLKVGSKNTGEQIAEIIKKTEEILLKEKPNLTFVLGDTNTVLGGAIAASNIPETKLVHIEAGCRSYVKTMPEEKNRVLTDHLADILFAPTKTAVDNLKKEGITKNVILSGSTGIEACLRNAKIAKENTQKTLTELKLTPRQYLVLTIHRAENTTPDKLKSIIQAINQISEKITIIFPIHPRTKKIMEQNNIHCAKTVTIIKPLGYLEFITLMNNAKIVMTDSGGAQEDCAVLKVPCVTLRDVTEWIETIETGANKLAGWKTNTIINTVNEILQNPETENKMRNAKPYWLTNPVKTIIKQSL